MSGSDRTTGTERKGDAPQRTSPSPDDRSPPELDQAILEASRRAVRFQWLHVLLEKLDLTRTSRWELVVALAVGVLAGIGLEPLTGEKREPVPSGVIHAGDPLLSPWPDEKADTSSPESWRKYIAALVLKGQIVEAQSQLRAFRQRYPDDEGAVKP